MKHSITTLILSLLFFSSAHAGVNPGETSKDLVYKSFDVTLTKETCQEPSLEQGVGGKSYIICNIDYSIPNERGIFYLGLETDPGTDTYKIEMNAKNGSFLLIFKASNNTKAWEKALAAYSNNFNDGLYFEVRYMGPAN